MKYIVALPLLFICIGLCLGSCENSDAPVQDVETSSSNDNQAVYAFLETFLSATPSVQKQLSKALRPNKSDLAAIFVDTAIQNRAFEYIEQRFDKEKFTLNLRKEHQDLEIWSASIEDFKKGNEVIFSFPSNFLDIIPFCQEDLTFHRFKFKIKDYHSGASYTGLTHVNGRWVIIPEAWKILYKIDKQH